MVLRAVVLSLGWFYKAFLVFSQVTTLLYFDIIIKKEFFTINCAQYTNRIYVACSFHVQGMLIIVTINKREDYVYVKGEKKIRHYFGRGNKVNKDKVLSYCEMLCKTISKTMKKWLIIHFIKFANPLSFQTRSPKRGPTYSRQLVDPRHQTPQGQSNAKPRLPLLNITMKNLNMTSMRPKLTCSI